MKKIILSLAILSFVNTYAQEKQPNDTINKTVNIKEVVISVTRNEEEQLKTSQQVDIIKSKTIKFLNTQTTADLLQAGGSLFVQRSQQGGGSPVIRGFEASRVLLMIDGVRMNNLIYRSGHLQNIITTDQNSLERIEVLFGPSSTAYGSDALGGVVHLYTLRPVLNKTKGNALFRYGTVNNEFSAHADINIGSKKWASLTSFTYSQFGDLLMGKSKGTYDSVWGKKYFYADRINGQDSMLTNPDPYRQLYTGYEQYDVVQKILFAPNDQNTHILNLQLSNTGDLPRYDRLTETSGGKPKFSRWDYGPQFRAMASYKYSHRFRNGFFNRMEILANYQRVEESRITRSFAKDIQRTQLEQVDVLGLDIDFVKKTDKHTLHAGLESYANYLKSTAENLNVSTNELTDANTRYPDGQNYRYTVGLYLTHQYVISDKWVLNDGLRAESISLYSQFVNKDFFPFPFDEVKQNNLGLSGNVGLNFLPDEKTKIGILFSTGYRAPNVDDLSKVFDTKPGERLIVPNPDIKPEKTYNAELNITRFFGSSVRWENVLYYTLFRDAIIVDAFSFNGNPTAVYDGDTVNVFAAQNKRRAFIYGFNSNIKADIGKHFSASGTVTYTYGRINTDSVNPPIDHIPPAFLRLGFQYYNPRVNSEFFVLMNGKKDIKDYLLNAEDNEQYATPIGMPAWYTLNIRLSYLIHKNFTLQTGIDNILDQNYRTFSSGMHSPGRNIFAALRMSF
jgi:hemoglobin/transferrin/lactoferrin receptor protein